MCAPLLGFGPVLKQPRKSQSHSPWSAVTPHPQGPFPVQASIPSMLSPGQAFPTWLSTLPRWLQCQGQSWRRTGDPDTQGVYVCVHSITFSKVSWQYLLLEEVQGEKLGCLIKRETTMPTRRRRMLCSQGPGSGREMFGLVWPQTPPAPTHVQHSHCLQPLAGHHHQEGFNARTQPSPRPEPRHSSMPTCPTKPNISHSMKSSSDCP